MNRKQIDWLLNEIGLWNREGLISDETARELGARYALLRRDSRSVALVILGSLGALLTGLGIISLLAANWGDLPRSARAVIAFLPLIIAYAAALYGILRRQCSPALCEPLGIFWGLSIGAGIALISQTYHLPGDMETFILTWMVLLVPVLWLTRSLGAVAGYSIGLLFWAGCVESRMGTGILYWPLSALALPLVIAVRRREPEGMRGLFMFWTLLASSIIALGMTLDKSLPGLWIIIYAAFFTVLLLWGSLADSTRLGFSARPLSLCGGGGLAVVLYLLCYEWPWRDIGPAHYRTAGGHYLWVAIVYDFTLTVLLFGIALVLFLRWRRGAAGAGLTALERTTHTLWYAAPMVTVVAYGIASCGDAVPAEACALLLTLYLAVLSLLTLSAGIAARVLWMLNGGMLLFLALIIGKFFSEEYSFTLKGIVFILSGAIFFTVNLIFARKLRSSQ